MRRAIKQVLDFEKTVQDIAGEREVSFTQTIDTFKSMVLRAREEREGARHLAAIEYKKGECER